MFLFDAPFFGSLPSPVGQGFTCLLFGHTSFLSFNGYILARMTARLTWTHHRQPWPSLHGGTGTARGF
jgi:hypothetical protein